jgi:ribonuclease HI
MPWVKATIRGQPVWAKADELGRPKAVRGRVEIRYQPQGKSYSANPANIEVSDPTPLPDDTCAPSEPRPAGRGRKSARTPGSTAATVPVAEAPDSETVIAYTDGACTGNPGPAGLGVVLLVADQRLEISEYLGNGTNNIAELTAILRALEAPEAEGRALVIHTDSQYAIGVLSKGWRAKKNVELIGTLRDHLKRHGRTTLRYVPGHAGVPLNERADELARLAITSRKSSRPPAE